MFNYKNYLFNILLSIEEKDIMNIFLIKLVIRKSNYNAIFYPQVLVNLIGDINPLHNYYVIYF